DRPSSALPRRRQPTPTCPCPRPSPCRRRNFLLGLSLQSESKRRDGPPPALLTAYLPDRAKDLWEPPKTSGRLPSPVESHSAAAWHDASAPQICAGACFQLYLLVREFR